MEPDDELTLKQAAAAADCSKSLVGAAVSAGDLPARRVGGEGPGGVWLVRRADLDAWNRGRRPRGRPRKPDPEPVYTVPFAGVVGAGPGKLDEFPDGATIRVARPQPDGVVAYLVSGDSMLADGVANGDTILVRRQPDPENNEAVVAWVEDAGMVFKKYRVDTFGRKYLMSGKWKHELTDRDRVYGVHVETIRKTQLGG